MMSRRRIDGQAVRQKGPFLDSGLDHFRMDRRPPTRDPLLFGFGFDPQAAQPLHAQLRDALRDAILARRLAPGDRLPASRVLAADLGCARGTVLLALEQLAAEGYIVARTGSGTRVAAALPEDLPAQPAPSRSAPAAPPVLSRRGAALTAAPAPDYLAPRAAPDAFCLGRPAPDAFPHALFAKLLQAEGRTLAETAPTALGHPDLRRAIAAYLAAGRGVACDPEAVIVTSGIRQSLRLLARLLLDPGEAAFVEEPGFPGIALALAEAGLRIVPVSVDAGGFAIGRARILDPEARLAVVTPAQHYPLGHAMSLENRLDLLAWAEARDAWIVEDDYDGAYRYAGRPLAPLRTLDRGGRVVYAGTFSKVLTPALQLSYLVLPDGLAEPVRRALAELGAAPALLGQVALARFIEEGHFAAHLRRTRRLYALRQEALVAAARAHADWLDVAPMQGGMHLVARPGPRWPAGLDDRTAAASCARAGVAAVGLSAYRARPGGAPGLLLGYAAVPERAIAPALRQLVRALSGADLTLVA